MPNFRQVWIQGKSTKRNRKCTFKLLNDGVSCTETLMVFNFLIHTSYILGCVEKNVFLAGDCNFPLSVYSDYVVYRPAIALQHGCARLFSPNMQEGSDRSTPFITSAKDYPAFLMSAGASSCIRRPIFLSFTFSSFLNKHDYPWQKYFRLWNSSSTSFLFIFLVHFVSCWFF